MNHPNESLHVDTVTKRFSASKTVFRNISDQFRPGELIAFIGPNGSGKTTMLRLLSVQSFPTSGHIRYGEMDIHQQPAAYLQHLGIVHDQESLPEHLSAVETLQWVLRSRSLWDREAEARIHKLLDRLQLGEDRHQQMGTYSTGMKKKTQIAAAFVVEPRVLILDEPMRGLDTSARDVVMEMLAESKNKQRIVLIASHTLADDSELVDRVLLFPLSGE
ncbi:MAG: ABC transporter ATP-binding protein [Balneolaceae bacterium]